MSGSLPEQSAASANPNHTPFSSPRTFHLFPELPTELRLKIWGIRFTHFTRVVNIDINEVSLEELVLTLTDDPVLPFRACKEESSESMKCFALEAGIRENLKTVHVKACSLDYATREFFTNGLFNYSRDIAYFQSAGILLRMHPYVFPGGEIMWNNLQHIGLHEVVAHIPHSSGYGCLGELQKLLIRFSYCNLPALKFLTITKLRNKKVDLRSRLAPLQPMSKDEIEMIVDTIITAAHHYTSYTSQLQKLNPPLVRILSFSPHWLHRRSPDGPSA